MAVTPDKLIGWVQQTCSWVVEIIKRADKVKGFKLLPRHWVVERTFSWLRRPTAAEQGLRTVASIE